MFKIIFVALMCFFSSFTTMQAERVYCNHPEKIRQDHIHYCCSHPDGHNDITEACAKKTGFKLPAANEEAVEDVTIEQVIHDLCWADCVFDKFGFIDHQNKLDMNEVRKYYSTIHFNDPEYMKEMIDAFEHCHGEPEAVTSKFVNSLTGVAGTKNCQSQSGIILSCVIYRFFHNCPRNRWANTTECEQTLKFAKKCKDVLTNM